MIDLLFGTVLPFLLVLTLLVFVHEMGHFLVARWAGVRVEAFAVGFGPEIAGFNDRRGTRWKLCWVPLGGYVKMYGDRNATSLPDADSDGLTPEQRRQSFPHQPLAWRAAIVAAGPAANFLLAILILAGLYVGLGVRQVPPLVGFVLPGSPAAEAGFQPGDRLLAVDGSDIQDFNDFSLKEQVLVAKAMQFSVERQGRPLTLAAVPARRAVYAADCRETRVNDLGLRPPLPPVVGSLSAGSAAEVAGLLPGDRILSVDGQPISHFLELADKVRGAAGQTLTLALERADGSLTERRITPQTVAGCSELGLPIEVGLIGVGPASSSERQKLAPLPALVRAAQDSWNMTLGTLRSIWQMITRDRGTEELGGPLGIATLVGSAASSGFWDLLFAAALLSLNLGLINLFPIPVLDGGHLLLYGYEAVRGKPLGLRAQELAFRIGFALILSLMIFATANDFLRALS